MREALKITEKSREAEGRGERERYTQLNVVFQRIARRDKKALSEQCKETEENNRMGKTRDLFKKMRDTKGTFHAKMGSIKNRNGKDLTEAEEVARNEELYEKGLNDPDNHDGVITQLESDLPWIRGKKNKRLLPNPRCFEKYYPDHNADIWGCYGPSTLAFLASPK